MSSIIICALDAVGMLFMGNRRLLLVIIAFLCAMTVVAEQALAQTFTEFPVPTAMSVPAGITQGPDGALWFTEASVSKIGRISTAGVVSEFPTPTAGAGSPLGAITQGPDGALWFTESGGVGKIG